MSLPRIIAVANQKGGVAKTTTCISLGACLAEQGLRALLIDLDPQAHLTLSLGVEAGTLGRTVADALMGAASWADVVRETPSPGLRLAPADQRLSTVERWAYGRPDYETLLKSQLDTKRGREYDDVIIIDSPPFLGTLMLNALTAADLLIIPTQCDYYASRSMYRELQLVQKVREKTNPRLAYRVLITMFDRRSRLAHMIRRQLERGLAGGLLKTVIDLDPRLRECALLGQPVTVCAPQSRAAIQYRALAQELMSHEW